MRANPDRKRRQEFSPHEEAHRRGYNHSHEEDRPRYVISVAAEILGVHPQTLRLYEREGLVDPGRTSGKIRLYSERDIEKVRCVMRLTNDLGVNLAGAEAILYMRERLLEMAEELEALRRQLDVDLDRGSWRHLQD